MLRMETLGSSIYVYIAGPYTQGDQENNTRLAILAAEEIASLGFIPFVPHLYHHWDKQVGHDYEYWMNLCTAWLHRCDCVFRICGYSPGAADEVRVARDAGKQIFYTPEKMLDYYLSKTGNDDAT